MIVPPEELLIAHLPLDVFYMFSTQDFHLTALDQVTLPLSHIPLYLPHLLFIVEPQPVFVLLHESVVHLRSLPLCVPVVELNQPQVRHLFAHFFSQTDPVHINL